MDIRDATPNDADAIAELNSAAWRVAFRGVANDDFLVNHDCDPSRIFEVGACYVNPAHWRQGIGRLLMNALFERLASSSWQEVKVWTTRDTPASHSFYRSRGFERDGRTKDHEFGDGSTVPVVRFASELGR
jgi:GNAT superfamily N-acetyltransferase